MRSFQSFLNNHNKNYLTKEEFTARYKIFAENVALIQSYNSGNESFSLGLNSFADMSGEEYGKLLGLLSSGDVEEGQVVPFETEPTIDE